MTYAETVEYLYTQLPMYQRHGARAFKKDLRNTYRLLEFLHNPHQNFKSVHVAGTNGKGSVTHMIAGGLQKAGFKTGIYCSPHLRDFRERIKIDGKWISKDFVVEFVIRIHPVISKIHPSFFEITVAMAFDYFAANEVDVAVVEVGMGGRLDSTNVLRPLLSVITNISYDHQQFLGNTLEEIAGEKAGIIKKNTPAVIGKKQAETIPVFERKAEALSAPLSFAEDRYTATIRKAELREMTVELVDKQANESLQFIVETGATYQLENIVTSIASLKDLKNNISGLDDESIVKGVSHFKTLTHFSGRWQVLQDHNPMVLADCAHNSSALERVFSQVLRLTFDRLHCVIGTVNDKDLDQFFSVLPREATYYFCKPNVPRGLDEQELATIAQGKGYHGRAYPSVEQAYRSALDAAGTNDLVYVGGSIFVVAEII